MNKREAYMLSSICPDFRINIYQVCSGLGRLMTTVGAEFPRKILPKQVFSNQETNRSIKI